MKGFLSIFRFLGRVFSFLRSTVSNLIFLVVVVVIIASIASAPKPRSPDNEALYIAPKGVLVDELTYQPSIFDLLSDQTEEFETRVQDLIDSINKAKDDERITGIVLNLNHMQGGGISKLTEIGEALDSFRESGKPVIAFADYFSQQQYYLANYADEIYVNELGGVLLTGYASYRNYYKDATDKLSLKFHVFRAGEYKDAVEPYIANNMSAASREHNARWLNELWGRYTSKIESARNLPNGAINEFIASMPEEFKQFGGSHARFSESAGLVDLVLTRKALRDKLIEHFGENKAGDSFAAINMHDYLAYKNLNPFEQQDNTIGVITASGTIMDGHQPAGTIGGESLSELIKLAREDETLKALVVRVNSGGGSAFASEIIRQELLETKAKGLPIYISMGSVAASGGYWISAPADEIWATPTTITGSIGVWGLYPNFSESLERIGVHTDGVATTKLAGAFRGDRPMDEGVKTILQAGVDNIYDSFLRITAEAREMEIAAVHDIAQGRVWTGATAKELGLVDELGSLNDVINAAASQQNLSDFSVKTITRPLSTEEKIMRSLMEVSLNIERHFSRVFLEHTFGEGVFSGGDNATANTSVFSELVRTSQRALTLPKGIHNEIIAQCLECEAP